MELILYTADCTGIPSNCVYPHEVVVDSKEKMGLSSKVCKFFFTPLSAA